MMRFFALLFSSLVFLSFTSCNTPDTNLPKVRLGLLNTGDTLPIIVAKEWGYFQEEGVEVEILNFQSGVERDAAFQSGDLDGMGADLIVSSLMKHMGMDIKVIALTLGQPFRNERVAILSSPSSGIHTMGDLRGKQLAIAPNCIIEFAADQLLGAHGIDPLEVQKSSVTKIPVRVSMLIEDQIEAAVLVDPLASFAETKGAHLLFDDEGDSLWQATLTFQRSYLENNTGPMRAFFRAYNRAVAEINLNRKGFQEMLVRVSRLPKEVQANYEVVKYPYQAVPSLHQVDRVLEWLRSKNLIDHSVTYEGLITDEFLEG